MLCLHSPMTGVFFRTLTFLEHDIKPVFVFDGKPPEEKMAVVSIDMFSIKMCFDFPAVPLVRGMSFLHIFVCKNETIFVCLFVC